jgi:transposase
MPRGIKSSPGFRAQACRQVLEFSRPIREVSTDLGISHETLRTWLRRERAQRQAMTDEQESDTGDRVSELEAENKQLRDDLYWAEQENSFLKKVSGFFAAENQPKRGSK